MPTRRTALSLIASLPAFAVARTVDPGVALALAACRQIGVTTGYDHEYHRIGYPGGDIPRSTGVCADVVVRAGRDAWGVDLQQLVHEDMSRDFAAYPKRWGLTAPDSNIDHRRVPNLETYWTRQGARLWHATSRTWGFAFPAPLAPGDILTWRTFMNGGPHVAIVTAGGVLPRIVQNFGWGVQEDPLAFAWLDGAEGHYRWRPAAGIGHFAGRGGGV
jgi:uncharacterized protein YijF (DUF1287 family)